MLFAFMKGSDEDVPKLPLLSRQFHAVLCPQSYAARQAFAQLRGSDNIVSFQTTRYDSQPLFIRGPGAGAEVTAAGVFSDLLLLARSLGARS